MTLRRELLRQGGRRGGFTLMEVLVVVAILVVLASVGVPIYLSYLEGAKKDTAKITANNLAQACQAFQVKYGRPAESLQELLQPPDGSAPLIEQKMLSDPWQQPYHYDPQGQHNAVNNKPDVYAICPSDGQQYGNW